MSHAKCTLNFKKLSLKESDGDGDYLGFDAVTGLGSGDFWINMDSQGSLSLWYEYGDGEYQRRMAFRNF